MSFDQNFLPQEPEGDSRSNAQTGGSSHPVAGSGRFGLPAKSSGSAMPAISQLQASRRLSMSPHKPQWPADSRSKSEARLCESSKSAHQQPASVDTRGSATSHAAALAIRHGNAGGKQQVTLAL